MSRLFPQTLGDYVKRVRNAYFGEPFYAFSDVPNDDASNSMLLAVPAESVLDEAADMCMLTMVKESDGKLVLKTQLEDGQPFEFTYNTNDRQAVRKKLRDAILLFADCGKYPQALQGPEVLSLFSLDIPDAHEHEDPAYENPPESFAVDPRGNACLIMALPRDEE